MAASNPPIHTETGNAISSNIKQLAWCTAREAQCVLKTIIDLIEVEGKSTESQTLRYREALDTVEDINKLGSKSEVFVELEVTILSKLILIYEQQKDAPTVRRFSLRRSKLKHPSSIISNPCHIAHTAQCWAETCGKLPELLDSLDLQIEAPLYANGIPRFPPQQSALRCGHSDIVDALCKLEGALQNLDMLKQNPVLAAAAVGDLSLLDTHLRNDKSLLKNRDLFQRTALFHTAHRGNLETLVTLVEAGANVLDRDEACQSILGIASAAGKADIVRWLLELGGVPSPNDHYFGSRSPLHDAARAGHTDVCVVLLEKGAYIDYAVDGVTAAQVARANGFNGLADMLDSALANPANRWFDAPRTLVQANDIQALDVRMFNPYACPPSLLPFEVRSAQHAIESSSSPNLLRSSLPATFAAEDEAKIDGQNLDHSIMMGESRELFRRREPYTQNQFSPM
jgi:Ankyrin repeats (3 copies)